MMWNCGLEIKLLNIVEVNGRIKMLQLLACKGTAVTHHSNASPGKDSERSVTSSGNWDDPGFKGHS